MKLALVVLATAATAAPALADERAMFVNFGGTVGIGVPPDDPDFFGESPDPEGVLVGRVTASWELPPLPYKEPRGYRWRTAAVPEVTLARLRIADHRNGDPDDNSVNLVMLGGRLEAGLSQRRGGLLQVSMRGGIYVAGRAGLLADVDRTPVIEVVAGEYFYIGDSVRLGVEAGLMSLLIEEREPVFIDATRPNARGPWVDQTGTYHAGVLTAYLGVKL